MNAYQVAFLVLLAAIALCIRAAETRTEDESFAEAFQVTFAIALVYAIGFGVILGVIHLFLWLGNM